MPDARPRSFVIAALAPGGGAAAHRRSRGALRALALAIVLGVHAGEPRSDVAEPRAYPPASTVLVQPEASAYRAHLARTGAASLTADGALEIEGGLEAAALEDELVVVDERGDRVRVLAPQDDGASMLLWLDARDLAWSIARTVRLSGRGDSGVWLSTGAPVTVARGRGATAQVTYRASDAFDDDPLTLRGRVPRTALTRIFPVTVEDAGDDDAAEDGRERESFEIRRLRAGPGGAILHRGSLWIDVLARRGEWTEVEYRSRYVVMRGWVGPQDVPDSGYGVCGCGLGGVGAFGYGVSDAQRIEIPRGACFHDRAGGEVVGIEERGQTRYSVDHDGDWWEVHVGTPWGLARVWARSLGEDLDGQPLWERCDRPESSGVSADP